MIGNKDGYALVTGASSGIGYELAKLFAKDGRNLVVVARSQDKLEGLKTEIESKYGTDVVVLPKDLSDPDAPQEIFSQLEKGNINVDVLVNNAGIALYGMFSETNWQREAEIIQVNISSLTHLTKLFLKKMLENKSGKIMNVASGIAFFPGGPLWSVYAATKSYVLHFSEALANEVQGTGVSVTCFCPAATRSLFWERANGEDCKAGQRRLMDTATAARVGYASLRKGKAVAIAGLFQRLMVFLSRLAPRGFVTRITRLMLE